MQSRSQWSESLYRIGGGLGFALGPERARVLVTAAHCLPREHVAAGAIADARPRYDGLVASLAAPHERAAAACVFADWVGDIAALQIAEHASLAPASAFQLGRAGPEGRALPVWLPSLNGAWFRCDVRVTGPLLWLTNAACDLVGGMSGAPIVAADGSAIGILCACDASKRGGGPNPSLWGNLPAWLLDRLIA
ncbi:MAG: trypsin-like peptidase domain-containing protein [Alphaproteobacteria bacterium]|nr:trypsin-like peptidase domain-containing protein [Alphaproteobacteria bacterium]